MTHLQSIFTGAKLPDKAFFNELLLQFRYMDTKPLEAFRRLYGDKYHFRPPNGCPGCHSNPHAHIQGDACMKMWKRNQKGDFEEEQTPPLTNFFVSEKTIKDFKASHPVATKLGDNGDAVCRNHFRATDGSTMDKRYSSGVFAGVCGHSFPYKAVSMDAGEKFAYFHCVLVQLALQEHTFAYLEYDVACRFIAYLRKHEQELARLIARAKANGTKPSDLVGHPERVAGMRLALGRFHAYAHQASCQINYAMLYKSGFGLVPDGEDCEKVWKSVLPLAGPTTLMSASNRADYLAFGFFRVQRDRSSRLPDKVSGLVVVVK